MSEQYFGREAGTPLSAAGGDRRSFVFHGTGKEYFGIWVVNILLSIVTLGIYSAWAKVRTKRYFNGNTELADHRFDYHANPIAILTGRIVVVIVLIAMNLLSQLNAILGLAIFAFYMVALPWVIVRGLRFNANMTSYRNIRFHFVETKWNAFKAYLLWPIAAMFTLGLLVPFASRANAWFLGNGHRFGTSQFSANPPLKPYYKALGVAVLFAIIPLAAVIGLTMSVFLGSDGLGTDTPDLFQLGMWQIMFVLMYLGFILAYLAYAAYARNIGLNNLSLAGGHRFESTVKLKPYMWISVTNFLLTIVTLGIYIPWARVRMARYLADNTAMMVQGDLDNFVGQQGDTSGVASGEFLDIEGMDFGF